MIDARRLYAFALDRPPESDAFVASFASFDFLERVRAFFGSAEFEARVIAPVLTTRRADGLGAQPPRSLLLWASRRLGLSEKTAADLVSARTWSDAYFRTLSDPAIQKLFGGDHPALQPELLTRLRQLSMFAAGLDDVRSDRVKGWIVSMQDPSRPVRVEIWINGAFAAAGQTTGFRRDIQDRWGGSGLAGFDILLPVGRNDGETRLAVELREASTGKVVQAVSIDQSPPDLTLLEALASQIEDLKSALGRVEQQMPTVQRSLGSPLSDYSAYHDRWLRAGSSDPIEGGMVVVLDAIGAEPRAIDEAAASVIAQGDAGLALIILADDTNRDMAKDVQLRASWRSDVSLRVVVADVAERAQTISALVATCGADETVLLTTASHVLAPNALNALHRALSGATCAYPDEDVFAERDMALDPGRRAHVAPVFKPGFDPDLLAQTCYVGETVAFRAGALNSIGLWSGAGPLYAADALFRLGLSGDAVAHVSMVLATRRQERDLDAWPFCVSNIFQTFDLEGASENHQDILGAKVPGALRWRYPAPDPTRAAVIVPTRDRIDLIKPCLESLFSNRSANRTLMEIIVVDHDNTDPETVAYLTALADQGEIRLVPYDGAFNWALMNNRAAAETEADVLVFLNDDTVVVSSDWLDELASQAIRPGVGVVGCRLVYADGTLQHAGFVLRETSDTFIIHDGVGAAGSDGGYLGRHALLHRTVAVTGACMAVSRKNFRELGGFDAANFPVEANDVDLCFRAAASGLAVLYDPYATLYHLESKTRGLNPDRRRARIAQEAMALLWERWGRDHGPDRFFNAHFDRSGQPFAQLRPPPRFASVSIDFVKAPIEAVSPGFRWDAVDPGNPAAVQT